MKMGADSSEGLWPNAKEHQLQRMDSLLEPLEGARPWRHFDFGLSASRTLSLF